MRQVDEYYEFRVEQFDVEQKKEQRKIEATWRENIWDPDTSNWDWETEEYIRRKNQPPPWVSTTEDVEAAISDWEKERIKPLEAHWTYVKDERFALACLDRLYADIQQQNVQSASPTACSTCKELFRRLLGQSEASIHAAELSQSEATCQLCRVLHQQLQESENLTQARIRSWGSMLMLWLSRSRKCWLVPTIRFGEDLPASHQSVSTRFPLLGNVRSLGRFELFRSWLRICDTQHKCHPRSQVPGPLPTRVLDVGEGNTQDSIKLVCAGASTIGSYTILSHRWGVDQDHSNFCTYRCNIDTRVRGFNVTALPQTFQDAVTVTRELGIRYLWIDSICIIQPHRQCSSECRSTSDWDMECENMQNYFSAAYCSIAATSATNSGDGFLDCRVSVEWVDVEHPFKGDPPCGSFFAIDDFRRDVEEAELNKRAWVLQERALSRRMLHFTHTQAYWECGDGIRCETLAKMTNPTSMFFSDPDFPNYLLRQRERNKVSLSQSLYSEYSAQGITQSTDRSIAIHGLEQRLANRLNSVSVYGTLRRYLHRSLLWSRSSENLRRIQYPDNRKVPSWSWMAWEGPIRYVDVPFEEVAWNHKIQLEMQGSKETAFSVKLKAPITNLNRGQCHEVDQLEYDDGYVRDLRTLYCLVLGKRVPKRLEAEPKYDIVLLERTSVGPGYGQYERVGLACLTASHLASQAEPELGEVV